MYVTASAAMTRRRAIESRTCAVTPLQQPGLGELGQGLVQIPGASSIGGLSFSPWVLAAAGGALLLAWLLMHRGEGMGSLLPPKPEPRKKRSKRYGLATMALTGLAAAGAGYVYGKYAA